MATLPIPNRTRLLRHTRRQPAKDRGGHTVDIDHLCLFRVALSVLVDSGVVDLYFFRASRVLARRWAQRLRCMSPAVVRLLIFYSLIMGLMRAHMDHHNRCYGLLPQRLVAFCIAGALP
jgi:hypothetical protein